MPLTVAGAVLVLPAVFWISGARKLPSSTNNLLGWVLPPLVICAVEAHPETPFLHR
jgi:hypothetical protein